MNQDYIELGKKLKVFRKRNLMLTQEELANKLNVSQENISQYENGTKNPKSLLDKISNTFNISKTEIEDIDVDRAFNIYGNIENSNVVNTFHNTINYNQVENTSLEEIKSTLQDIVKCVDFLIKKEKGLK